MPRKINKNKSKRNRNNKRRGLNRNRRNLLGKPVGGFLLKNMYKVRLRVSEYFQDTNGTDTLNYIFIANGLYNPYATYASTQPAGFNYYMSAYLKYRVLGCKIRVRSVNTTTTGQWLAIYPTLQNIPFTTIVQAETQKYSMLKIAGSKDSTPIISLNKFCTSRQIFGHNPYDDEDFSGDFGSNPPFKWYWVLLFYNPGGVVTTSCVIDMEFDIVFYGRKTQDESTPSLMKSDDVLYNKFLETINKKNGLATNTPDLVDYKEELL